MGKKPKISVNKLGEFVTATSIRQKSIVKDQSAKRPPGIKAFRYTEARATCVRYFTESFDVSIIDKSIEDLKKKILKNKHDQNDQQASIESLNELKNIDLSHFEGLSFSSFSGKGIMDINGVDVSVQPDLILRGEYKKKKVIGAIKFHIKKTEILKPRSQAVIATILQQFIDKHVKAEEEKAVHNLMFSVDIFGGSIAAAPKSQAQILTNVDAACWLYKLIWHSLEDSEEPLAT
ncbi:hypothetical protein GCM10028805_36410 [Spirosoma harenae]